MPALNPSVLRERAARLDGTKIQTLARAQVNGIVAVDAKRIWVATARSIGRKGGAERVRWEWIDEVIDTLNRDREVSGEGLRARGRTGGFRSAFVLALLATLFSEDVEVLRKPLRLRL